MRPLLPRMRKNISKHFQILLIFNILLLTIEVLSQTTVLNQQIKERILKRVESDSNVQGTFKSNQKKENGRKNLPKFQLDENTKVIYVDESSEQGYLIGELDTSKENILPSTKPANSKGSLKNLGKFGRNKLTEDSNPTNYSVYLVSNSQEHFAILIDVEEIDFEPIINCENQELRFSVVGEISKKLLDDFNKTSTEDEEEAEIEDGNKEASDATEQTKSSLFINHETVQPTIPVSEAMTMLLNAPLNKTILNDSLEINDFKVIDSTIDFLREDTFDELEYESIIPPDLIEKVDEENVVRQKKSKRKYLSNFKDLRSEISRRVAVERAHSEESKQFKDIMFNKLSDYFMWDDFKIICGKTKQLLVPMRSLKLSVYSDEFAPKSRFVLKYKFISDPNLLPSQDNEKYYCRNRNVIDLSLKCDGVDDCGDASDESVKICGYPVSSTRGSFSNQATLASSTSRSNHSTNGGSSSTLHTSRKKLTYVNGDMLHCCQSSDWLSFIHQSKSSQVANLQSLIGDSMNLFSTPLFAPTKNEKRGGRVKRIVGGGVSKRGAWPAQASLQYELIEPLCQVCAGTLIHPQYVLTAGHCISKDGLNRGLKVVFGAHDLRQTSGNHIQTRYVDDAQIYPGVDVKALNFDWENDMNNDIALLRLNAPVLVTPSVTPACLPPYNTPLTINTTCRSIGWGQTHGSGNSNLLKQLSLKVVNSTMCSQELSDRDNDEDIKFKGDARFAKAKPSKRRSASEFDSSGMDQYSDKTMVCVNNDLGHGICQGDSGGPLYCDRITSTGEICTEVYGVASFIFQYATVGALCAVENLPGIFGEVSSKTEWILSTMKMFEQTYRLKYS